VILILTTALLSRGEVKTTKEYFVGTGAMPLLAVAISVLATSQSAATFLGGPEFSYSKDLTFLGFYLSALIGVLFVAFILIPRFYAIGAVTVYELLEHRYGARAKKEAGVMFLIGRLFASGARLYIGALAVSMILFMDIEPLHVALSVAILMLGSMGYTYFGGIRSIIYGDVIQAVIYVGAALSLMIFLYTSLNTDFGTMVDILEAEHKLKVVDTTFGGEFDIYTLLFGWMLLNIAAYGLDQDMTQRVLTCKNSAQGSKSLIYSILLTIPIAFMFLVIGLLLYLFYHHPELSFVAGKPVQSFEGDKITILMYYILHEMPSGLRGFVTVAAIAVTISSTSSVLGAMSSVIIEDIYRPWRLSQNPHLDEKYFLKASRLAVIVFAVALSLMAILSYYWQHATQSHLLNFALGVMSFAYAGLLGVYFAVLFTRRGSGRSVTWALIGGFLTVLLLQNTILKFLGIDLVIGFSWQLVLGTMVSFGIMMMGKGNRT